MGGKRKDKLGGLGRALIRQHKQSILEAKERGRALRQQQRVLESITDVADIDAVIEQAEEAERNYSIENSNPTAPIKLDETVITTEEDRREAEALYASSIRVPRRPPWNETMTLEEFDDNERQSFLVWRRNLAKLEENEKLVLTPFEKNLDIWRQLDPVYINFPKSIANLSAFLNHLLGPSTQRLSFTRTPSDYLYISITVATSSKFDLYEKETRKSTLMRT